MNGFLYEADGTSSCICSINPRLFISKDDTPFSFFSAADVMHQAAFSFLASRFCMRLPFK